MDGERTRARILAQRVRTYPKAVRFDEKTGELSIEKNHKVLAKTAARLEKRSRKSAGIEVQTTLEVRERKLVAITFGGSDQNVMVNQGGM